MMKASLILAVCAVYWRALVVVWAPGQTLGCRGFSRLCTAACP